MHDDNFFKDTRKEFVKFGALALVLNVIFYTFIAALILGGLYIAGVI